MKDIVIACDGSFGLDTKRIILAINAQNEKSGIEIPYCIKGFIGTDRISNSLMHHLSPYLGSISEWVPSENEYIAMAIFEPHVKKDAVEQLKSKGAHFETICAPWVLAHPNFKFPEGCIIAAHSVMDSAKIGSFVTLFHSMVGFDAIVEDYSSVMAFANITTAHIGKCVMVDNNAVVISKTVHNDAVVKPNSVVVKEVKAGTVVWGNPAKRIRFEG